MPGQTLTIQRFPMFLALGWLLGAQNLASAHCDTLDGPVVAAARAALESREVTPVLKWVRAVDEQEIKAAFARSLAVRTKGAEARELADLYFFETVVRVHRAGEGAAYTGLKGAGEGVTALVKEADKAIESGSSERLIALATREVASAVHSRLSQVKEMRVHMNESVAAGREFVAAYVRFIHYLERLESNSEDEHQHGAAEPASKRG